MRPGRRAALLAATALVALGTGAALGDSATGNPCAQGNSVYERGDGWSRISPSNLNGPIRDYTVPPGAQGDVYATDGIVITRSLNDGCTWQEVAKAPTAAVLSNPVIDQDVSVKTAVTIDHLTSSGYLGSHVYALGHTTTADGDPAPQSVVYASPNGTFWFDENHPDLPPPAVLPGAPLSVVAAADNGGASVAYVATRLPSGALAVYRSDDGGGRWSPTTTGSYDGITVDPLHPSEVAAWGQSGLALSHDSGASFQPTASVTGPVAEASFVTDSRGNSSLVAYYSGGGGAVRLRGSTGWRPLPGPAAVDGVDRVADIGGTFSRPGGAFALTSKGHLYREEAVGSSYSLVDATPQQVGKVRRPQSVSTGGNLFGQLYVTDSVAIYRAQVVCFESGSCQFRLPPPPPRPDVNLGVPPKRKDRPVTISPGRVHVRMRPGQAKTVPLTLDLPAVPTPLDVMFLVDTTVSMSPTIDGLRQGIGQIVRDLTEAGIDAQFGVGDFQDYPAQPYGCPAGGGPNTSCGLGSKPDHPYERLLKISPVGQPLRNAIGSLTLGSGGDQPESTLAALKAAATGQGQPIAGVPTSYWIQPGMGAEWRPGALRVIVVATDINFHAPPPPGEASCEGAANPTELSTCQAELAYPGPRWDDVVGTLTSNGIRVVGVDVSGNTASLGKRDLRRIARETGTLAPAGGTDCNANGTIDLKEGQPLVCSPEATDDDTLELAPPIVALLKSLRDFAPVEFTADEPEVLRLAPSVVPQVDLKAENLLHFNARLSCPAGDDTFKTFTIKARVRGYTLANAYGDLECVSDKPPAVFPPAAVIAPLVPAVIAPAPPPPPPGQPPPANPNPNPNPNPQPGAAAEQQDEAQLAMAVNDELSDDSDSETGVEVAMSARTPTPPAGLMLMWAGLGAATIGAGVAVRRRRSRAEGISFAWSDA